MVVFIFNDLESNFVTSVGALYGDTTVQLSVILSVDVFDCSSVSVSFRSDVIVLSRKSIVRIFVVSLD